MDAFHVCIQWPTPNFTAQRFDILLQLALEVCVSSMGSVGSCLSPAASKMCSNPSVDSSRLCMLQSVCRALHQYAPLRQAASWLWRLLKSQEILTKPLVPLRSASSF